MAKGEFGEGVRNPVLRIDVGGKFVVAATQVLDENVPRADHSDRAQPFETAWSAAEISGGRDLLACRHGRAASMSRFPASAVLFADESGGPLHRGTIRNRLRYLMELEGRPLSGSARTRCSGHARHITMNAAWTGWPSSRCSGTGRSARRCAMSGKARELHQRGENLWGVC